MSLSNCMILFWSGTAAFCIASLITILIRKSWREAHIPYYVYRGSGKDSRSLCRADTSQIQYVDKSKLQLVLEDNAFFQPGVSKTHTEYLNGIGEMIKSFISESKRDPQSSAYPEMLAIIKHHMGVVASGVRQSIYDYNTLITIISASSVLFIGTASLYAAYTALHTTRSKLKIRSRILCVLSASTLVVSSLTKAFCQKIQRSIDGMTQTLLLNESLYEAPEGRPSDASIAKIGSRLELAALMTSSNNTTSSSIPSSGLIIMMTVVALVVWAILYKMLPKLKPLENISMLRKLYHPDAKRFAAQTGGGGTIFTETQLRTQIADLQGTFAITGAWDACVIVSGLTLLGISSTESFLLFINSLNHFNST